MTTTFDSTVRPSPLKTGLQAVPKRAVLVAAAAALALLAGAAWITSPASSVSTDDAYVKADTTIVAPKVHGLIAQVLVRDNQWVNAGQPLVRIDPDDYQQAVTSAEADVAAAEAALGQQPAQQQWAEANARAAGATVRSAEAEKARASADRARFDILVQSGDVSRRMAEQMRATSASADADADKSRAALAASEQQVNVIAKTRAQLEAGLAKAKAELAMAKLNLEHTIVRAPVSGLVGDRQAQIGEYVQPGTQLMTVVPVNTIYVVANYKETQTSRMLVGQHVRVEIDALPGRSFDGVIESFAPASGSETSLLPFEPATGNFTRIVQRIPVRIRILPGQKDADRLRPGLSADVRVDLS
jgi:membrane fusion protein (multidrug efflux system)